MKTLPDINLCRPGYSASCAFCCGSHNFNTNDKVIASILKGKTACQPPPIHKDGIRCPHIGFIDERKTLIGCMIYDKKTNIEKMDKFFKVTCKNFYCPAHDILTAQEVLFAAELMADWYYYGLFINEALLLKESYKKFKHAGCVPSGILMQIKEKLRIQLFAVE